MENEIIIKNYKNKCISPYNIQEIMEIVYNSLDIVKEINPYLAYFAIKTIRKEIKKVSVMKKEIGIEKENVNGKELKAYD